jgi:hypothetical protein
MRPFQRALFGVRQEYVENDYHLVTLRRLERRFGGRNTDHLAVEVVELDHHHADVTNASHIEWPSWACIRNAFNGDVS